MINLKFGEHTIQFPSEGTGVVVASNSIHVFSGSDYEIPADSNEFLVIFNTADGKVILTHSAKSGFCNRHNNPDFEEVQAAALFMKEWLDKDFKEAPLYEQVKAELVKANRGEDFLEGPEDDQGGIVVEIIVINLS
jgi:hypothetical protein